MSLPFVTVIVPCRNEARHLAACLDSIVATAYPRNQVEIVVVDGMSTDSTRLIAEAYAGSVTRCNGIALKVIANPAQTAPAALNIGIRQAKGDVIARMDAHALYPADYLPRLVEALDATGADNVGGVLDTRPASDAVVARAIAAACSHPFGVGNSRFRIGAQTNQWVDTVPFGCWRRKLFTWLGMFDEELVRNQDDELNHRLLARGGRILLVANVTAQYFARERLGQVARMFYQYGLFKPLVVRKIGRVMTGRQLVPPALTLGLLFTALLAPGLVAARWLGAALALVYGGAIVVTAARLLPKLGVRAALVAAVVFPIMHLSYGWGFLAGIVRWSRHPRTSPDGQAAAAPIRAVPLSR
ncbi:MAG TPA: glycosyltransferase family 2 protein [Gemmatimonadales bacterium]|nr:glycosyltransferase family 2 protein [Gemmatimonadales bacterium]